MNRRDFLLGSAAAAALQGCQSSSNASSAERADLPGPRPAQLAWQQAELGVVFHYDLHLFDDVRYVQSQNRKQLDIGPEAFNPTELDTDQWIASAVAAGARFAILTASHETGFRLWPSDANPYSVRNAPWRGGRGDLVGEFVASCRRAGIEPGVYLGTRWNAHIGVHDFRTRDDASMRQGAYNRLIEREVEEICSRYGPLFELWFDGGILAPADGGPDVLPIFERHQADCLFYHSDQRADARWGGTESGTVGDPCWSTIDLGRVRQESWSSDKRNLLRHGDPDGQDWCPAMADAPLRNHEWFWEPDDEHKLYSVDQLAKMYFQSVGRNSTLILGATPDRRGLVPDADYRRMQAMGKAVKAALGSAVATTSGPGNTLELDFPAARAFDVVVLQEDIRHGERIRDYVIESRVGYGSWNVIATGTCVGHKHIHRIAEVEAHSVRLRVRAANAEPRILRFELRHSRS